MKQMNMFACVSGVDTFAPALLLQIWCGLTTIPPKAWTWVGLTCKMAPRCCTHIPATGGLHGWCVRPVACAPAGNYASGRAFCRHQFMTSICTAQLEERRSLGRGERAAGSESGLEIAERALGFASVDDSPLAVAGGSASDGQCSHTRIPF